MERALAIGPEGVRGAVYLRRTILVTLMAGLPALPLACDSVPESEDPDIPASCGDGVCDADRCETPLRCAHDCGTCLDEQCTLFSAMDDAKCGGPCTSSCDCGQPGEVCSVDFEPPGGHGKCVPVACLKCKTPTSCTFTPDSAGRCDAATCT